MAHTCDCSDASCRGELNPLRLPAIRNRKNVLAPSNGSASERLAAATPGRNGVGR
jgi:hypothetical protein